MAKDRGRDGCGWVALSLIISPIIVIIILFALGETNERRINRIVEEEELRERIRRGERIELQNFERTKITITTTKEEDEAYEEANKKADKIFVIMFIIFLAISIALLFFFL